MAYRVASYSSKTDVIVASILHDIVEDTSVTIGMVLDQFGWRVAEIVDRLTRNRPNGDKLSIEVLLREIYNKRDRDAMLIKMMDRLHNTLTLDVLPRDKQKEKVEETVKYFLILAEVLSLTQINGLLYQECLRLNIKLGIVKTEDVIE